MIKRVLLVGNPNCGKTTLFNALTGGHQKVGNWPGVTVEKKSGWVGSGERNIELIDLPGVYSLDATGDLQAKDAQITAQVLAEKDFDLIVNVIDACHLERHLYLTSQLLALKKPMVVALNMMDMAEQMGIQIHTQVLAKQITCPVIALQAHRKIGLEALDIIMRKTAPNLPKAPVLSTYMPKKAKSNGPKAAVSEDDLDIIVADARYQMVHAWVTKAQSKATAIKEQFTAKLDRLFLHRFWGIPLFFTLMYCVFFLAIGVGGALQIGFDMLSQAIFMQMPAMAMAHWHAPAWLIQITALGAGQACHTLITFIPVLTIMYFLLSFLEASGYMARVAFIMDRAMRSLGLPGQAFVPLIIGFGCNVPAILASRTMQTERDRFLTVLMNPYMSCSARLAIYAVFVAAFFPSNGYQVIFSLYLLGIGMAVLTGYLARKTFLTGQATPLILELPNYHCPGFMRLCSETGVRLRLFLWRAGKMIIPICMLLSFFDMAILNHYDSLFSYLRQWVMPIFSPMGIHADNWPAVVSLVTGTLAKEVVVGTLTNLYSQIDHLTQSLPSNMSVHFLQTCWDAVVAIGVQLQNLFGLAVDQNKEVALDTLPLMLRKNFVSPAAAYAYLLFILLYIPCVSTMAAIRQETTRRLMWFSIIWSLGLAYGAAVLFYQISLGLPATNVYYLSVGVLLLLLLWIGIRKFRWGDWRAVGNS